MVSKIPELSLKFVWIVCTWRFPYVIVWFFLTASSSSQPSSVHCWTKAILFSSLYRNSALHFTIQSWIWLSHPSIFSLGWPISFFELGFQRVLAIHLWLLLATWPAHHHLCCVPASTISVTLVLSWIPTFVHLSFTVMPSVSRSILRCVVFILCYIFFCKAHVSPSYIIIGITYWFNTFIHKFIGII